MDGQPDEEDFPFIAMLLGSAFEIQQPHLLGVTLRYGQGELAMVVSRVMHVDEEGHESWHYIVRRCFRLCPPRRRISRKSPAHLYWSGLSAPIASSSSPGSLDTVYDAAEVELRAQPSIGYRHLCDLLHQRGHAITVMQVRSWLRDHRERVLSAISDRAEPPSSFDPVIQDAMQAELLAEPTIGYRDLLPRLQQAGHAISRHQVRSWLREHRELGLDPGIQDAMQTELLDQPTIGYRVLFARLQQSGYSISRFAVKQWLQDHRVPIMQDLVTEEEGDTDIWLSLQQEQAARRLILRQPSISPLAFHEQMCSQTATSVSRCELAYWFSKNRESILAEVNSMSADCELGQLRLAHCLLRDNPFMGADPFWAEYCRISGEQIQRVEMRRWFANNVSSIRLGRLDPTAVRCATELVVLCPDIGRRLLLRELNSRLGYTPPRCYVEQWLTESRHLILSMQDSVPITSCDYQFPQHIRLALPRLVMENPDASRAEFHAILRARYGEVVPHRALQRWWASERGQELDRRKEAIRLMPVLSLESVRGHMEFLRPFMSDAESAIRALEHHLRLTCTMPVMERVMTEAAISEPISAALPDLSSISQADVDDLLQRHPGMSVRSMHNALRIRGILISGSELAELVRTRRGFFKAARTEAVGGHRRLSLSELDEYLPTLIEHAGSASSMIAALEYFHCVTCSIACMSRFCATRSRALDSHDTASPAWALFIQHQEHLEDQIRRCPTISRSSLLLTLQLDCECTDVSSFDVWWQRHRPAIIDAWLAQVAAMPIASLVILAEHQEFILSLSTKSETVAIHALRYHHKINCSRRTMRCFLSHYVIKPDSDIARLCRVRKRPAARILVQRLSDLIPHQEDLRQWIEAGYTDHVIVARLGAHVGKQCNLSIIAQFRARERAASDIQVAWRAYMMRSFLPEAYGHQPSHGRGFSRGVPLLDWIRLCSWTFCDACGRRRPNSSLSELSCPDLLTPSVSCRHKRNFYGKCGRSPVDHVHVPSEERSNADLDKFATGEAYVSPRREDWPVYDETRRRYVTCTGKDDHRPSMLDLTSEEVGTLQLIDLFCDYRRQRGKRKGLAPVFNYKKCSVIRAEWRRVRPDDAVRTERACAALGWFKQDHPTYAKYYQMHQKILSDHDQDSSLPWYILTPRLLLDMDGVEVAARPMLYPHFAYGDSDMRSRLVGTHIGLGQTLSMKASVLRKCLSLCGAYQRDVLWIFLMHDIIMARNCSAMISMAERRGLPPEALASRHQQTEAYWRREQDCHADIIRQMRQRCRDRENYPDLWAHCNMGRQMSLAFPNLFLTIAPCEWKFPLLYSLFEQYKFPENEPKLIALSELGGPLALHLYNVLMSVMSRLIGSTEFWRSILNYVIRVEFQGRGTLHIHVAMWALLYAHKDLRGKSGEINSSALVDFLSSIGFESIDIQYGEGYLNYINGYVNKASDALDFRLREHLRAGESHRWRITYRLLCKASPCIPEIFIGWSGLPLMRRSFQVAEVYPPVPRWDTDLEQNDSYKLYGHYLKSSVCSDGCRRQELSFISYARRYRLGQQDVLPRKLRQGQMIGLGVRFAFELLDIAIGQYAVMFLPHTSYRDLCPHDEVPMEYTRCFVGTLQYLSRLRCGDTIGFICNVDGTMLARSAFPSPDLLPAHTMADQPLFPEDNNETAFRYLSAILDDELADRVPVRGRRDTLQHRLRAVLRLYCYIEDPPDRRRIKLEEWGRVHHVSLCSRQWSQEQQQALDRIRDGLDISDANAIREAERFIYLSGDPGSGKSEVVVHAAVAAAEKQLTVGILCPTGTLVHSYRDRLPCTDRIIVETLHSGFQISRKADMVVEYLPPTRLRRYDLILIDEASQVEDHIAQKILVAIAELPQKPIVVIAADFAQLRPVGGGSIMKELCDRLPNINLRTIHRTRDPGLLEFLKIARHAQPQKSAICEFFHGRILNGQLCDAVAKTTAWMRASPGRFFVWLCVTNSGADKVNAAVLSILGIASTEGIPGDPKVNAGRIVVRVGLYVRLTRNLDKDRGFVNGAIGVIEVVLSQPQGVFLVRLTTGTLVLVHPIAVDDAQFLPCTYGYATTIRRAQGASLDAGCLYFDHCYPPERGYAYVGASRFKTKQGVFLFGRVRRSDWLPVVGGGHQAEDVIDRCF